MQNDYGEGVVKSEVLSRRQAEDLFDAVRTTLASGDVGEEDRPEGVGSAGSPAQAGLHGSLKSWVYLVRGEHDNSWRYRRTDGYALVLQIGGHMRVTKAEYCPATGEIRAWTRSVEYEEENTELEPGFGTRR